MHGNQSLTLILRLTGTQLYPLESGKLVANLGQVVRGFDSHCLHLHTPVGKPKKQTVQDMLDLLL